MYAACFSTRRLSRPGVGFVIALRVAGRWERSLRRLAQVRRHTGLHLQTTHRMPCGRCPLCNMLPRLSARRSMQGSPPGGDRQVVTGCYRQHCQNVRTPDEPYPCSLSRSHTDEWRHTALYMPMCTCAQEYKLVHGQASRGARGHGGTPGGATPAAAQAVVSSTQVRCQSVAREGSACLPRVRPGCSSVYGWSGGLWWGYSLDRYPQFHMPCAVHAGAKPARGRSGGRLAGGD